MSYEIKWRPKRRGVDGRDGYVVFARHDTGKETEIGEARKASGGFEFNGAKLADPIVRRTMRELLDVLAAHPDVVAAIANRTAGSPESTAPGAGRVPMTAEGHKRLEEELRKLRTEDRPAIVKAIAAAREHGDLSENAEYHAARERQGFVEGRMRELEDKLGRAQVIDVSKLSGDRVKFGATVTLADEDTDEEKTWRIVGADESDPERGRLSVAAPLARAMINKSVGDSFTFDAPSGARSYEILAVEFR